MSFSPSFYLSFATLVIGTFGGIYLFVDWLFHRQYTFALFWSLGLFLNYWFQIPTILANFGIRLTLTDYNSFYLITFSSAFLAFILLYVGILSIFHAARRKTHFLLAVWFFLSLVIYAIYFGLNTLITNYLLVAIIFLFFFPIKILILGMLWKWFKGRDHLHSRISRVGVFIMIVAILTSIAQTFLALNNILIYPPSFWFFAIVQADTLFVLQSLSTLLFLAGFLLVHKRCCILLDSKNTIEKLKA